MTMYITLSLPLSLSLSPLSPSLPPSLPPSLLSLSLSLSHSLSLCPASSHSVHCSTGGDLLEEAMHLADVVIPQASLTPPRVYPPLSLLSPSLPSPSFLCIPTLPILFPSHLPPFHVHRNMDLLETRNLTLPRKFVCLYCTRCSPTFTTPSSMSTRISSTV